jgi:hypothetical protein
MSRARASNDHDTPLKCEEPVCLASSVTAGVRSASTAPRCPRSRRASPSAWGSPTISNAALVRDSSRSVRSEAACIRSFSTCSGARRSGGAGRAAPVIGSECSVPPVAIPPGARKYSPSRRRSAPFPPGSAASYPARIFSLYLAVNARRRGRSIEESPGHHEPEVSHISLTHRPVGGLLKDHEVAVVYVLTTRLRRGARTPHPWTQLRRTPASSRYLSRADRDASERPGMRDRSP